jgi:large subunit ribosomal protein L4
MELQLQPLPTTKGESTPSLISVLDAVFSVPFKEPLIHQAVTAYLAGGRKGTRSQKSRGEVKGSGSKPWRQKGTGRARAGSIKSPLWRGGGVTFAAKPTTNYAQKLNKKMYRGALRSILSELIRQERLLVIEQINLAAPKTKEMKQWLEALQLSKVLIVLDSENPNVKLAAQNLPNIEVLLVRYVNPVSLIKFPKVLFTVAALKKLEEQLG